MKYVKYGKVTPPPEEEVTWLLPAYKWLSNYCGGYCPQIWLSRSRSDITGYRNNKILKKRRNVISRRANAKVDNNSVLFGFDIIKGFPVNYEHWCTILTILVNCKSFEDQNKEIVNSLNEFLQVYHEEGEPLDNILVDWVKSKKQLDVFLKKYVFRENDQFVLPSLNLKSAKKILCRNEKQKKKLRKMGFIEDRIYIKNIKPYKF